jgi:hypothetical protein
LTNGRRGEAGARRSGGIRIKIKIKIRRGRRGD